MTPDSHLRATAAMWGYRKTTTIYKSESWLSDSDIKSASILILDFPASGLWEINLIPPPPQKKRGRQRNSCTVIYKWLYFLSLKSKSHLLHMTCQLHARIFSLLMMEFCFCCTDLSFFFIVPFGTVFRTTLRLNIHIYSLLCIHHFSFTSKSLIYSGIAFNTRYEAEIEKHFFKLFAVVPTSKYLSFLSYLRSQNH